MQFLDEIWTAYYAYIQNDQFTTSAMAILIHECVLFLSCFFWLVVEQIHFFQRWRIQPGKTYITHEKAKASVKWLLTHLTTEVPFVWFLLPVCQKSNVPYTAFLPQPLILLFQVTIFMILEPRLHLPILAAPPSSPPPPLALHSQAPSIYKAPFALAAEYANPFEASLYALSAISIPLLCHTITVQVHLASIMGYFVARMLQTFDSHCGYDFPWGLRSLLPGIWAGSRHHDMLHEKTMGNYAGMFCWWDRVCGTETETILEKKKLQRDLKIGRKGLGKRVTFLEVE